MNSWYLRKPDGREFGPESIETLVNWAEQSRILAGNEISQDRKKWQLVEDVAELNICYIAILPDKSVYGPFNIQATRDLIAHNVFTKDTIIVNKRDGKEVVAADLLKQNHKKKKSKSPKKISGQSDFDLLSSPDSELQKNFQKPENKDKNKDISKKEKKRQTRDKMDSTNQELLFKDEDDFVDDLQYVVDEDAQIEMPFEEEQTVIYNGENFPTPTQNNTVFISKDTKRFPELVTKKTILSIDDIQPTEDHRQVKLFEEEIDEIEAEKQNPQDDETPSIEEDDTIDPPDDDDELMDLDDDINVSEPEDDIKDLELSDDNAISEKDDNNAKIVEEETSVEKDVTNNNNNNPKTNEPKLNTDQLDDLKLGLETTTKLFVEQQTKDQQKIKELTAERNKLEQEVSNASDSIKELKDINQNLELSLKEVKQQLNSQFEQSDEKDEIIKKLEEENSKSLNALDVNKEKINELVETTKDLTLALAAERDKLKKQEKLTIQYQTELDEAEEKHNKIIENFAEKEAELLEEKETLEASNENLISNHQKLEEKIKDMENNHIQATKNLEEKLIAIRQELKAEEELKETFKKDVKELQSKIKSTDTIVNERMRSINEQTTRISTKYKQECRQTERLATANKKLMITLAVLILIIILGSILYIFTLKSKAKTEVSENIPEKTVQSPTLITEKVIEPPPPLRSENINLAGAKTYKEGKLVKVVFDEAMFSKLSSPSAFAVKNTRKNLIQYKKYLNDYNVVIEGHTDDSPMNGNSKYKNNQALGMARAESFKKLLVISFGLPGESISTVSAGSYNPPFSNSTTAGREKNKTVVLYFKNKTF